MVSRLCWGPEPSPSSPWSHEGATLGDFHPEMQRRLRDVVWASDFGSLRSSKNRQPGRRAWHRAGGQLGRRHRRPGTEGTGPRHRGRGEELVRGARAGDFIPQAPTPAGDLRLGAPHRLHVGVDASGLSSVVSLMKSHGGCFSLPLYFRVNRKIARAPGPRPRPPWICGLLVSCKFR